MLIGMSRTVFQIPSKYTLLMQHNKVSFKAFASANHLSCISYCCIKHLRYSLSLSLSLLAVARTASLYFCAYFMTISLSLSHTYIVTTYRKAFCSPQTSIRFQCSIFNSFATNPPPPMPHATCNKMRGGSGRGLAGS